MFKIPSKPRLSRWRFKLSCNFRDQALQGRRFFRNPRLYEFMELKEGFTAKDLKRAYYKKAQFCHPDHKITGSYQHFVQLCRAYDILEDPVLRKNYDNLTPLKYEEFVKTFNALYDPKSEIGIRSAETIAGVLPITSSVKQTLADKVQSIYDFFRSPKKEETVIQKPHTYIVLDNSASMHLFSTKYNKELCVTKIGEGTNEGKTINVVEIPKHKQKLTLERTYIGLSITQIREMMQDFLKIPALKESYVSLKIFSTQERFLFRTTPEFVLRQLHHSHQENWEGNNEFTALYDTIKNSINSTQELKLTTFVVLTDGEDNYGSTTLGELVKLILDLKEVNIVIIAMNMDNVRNLERIAKAAKTGKVIQVGDRYQTLSDAFAETKELIMTNTQVTTTDEIKRMFGM